MQWILRDLSRQSDACSFFPPHAHAHAHAHIYVGPTAQKAAHQTGVGKGVVVTGMAAAGGGGVQPAAEASAAYLLLLWAWGLVAVASCSSLVGPAASIFGTHTRTLHRPKHPSLLGSCSDETPEDINRHGGSVQLPPYILKYRYLGGLVSAVDSTTCRQSWVQRAGHYICKAGRVRQGQ